MRAIRMNRGVGAGLVLAAVVCWAGAALGQPASEVERLRAQNAELRQRVAELEAQLAELRGELVQTREEAQDLTVEKRELEKLAGVTAKGERVASARARFEARTDDDTGRTMVWTDHQQLEVTHGSAADHYLTVAYPKPDGPGAAETTPVTVHIQTQRSGTTYRGQDEVVWLAEGEEVARTAITDYHANRRVVNVAGKRRLDRGDERFATVLSPAELRELARAVEVTAQVGPVRYRLRPEQAALFAAARERLERGL